ncbi:MAG TPA: chromate transporter [Candidatus Binatia bacterium]|nr:chromate transporter [Candidatus Binatia bacterium]
MSDAVSPRPPIPAESAPAPPGMGTLFLTFLVLGGTTFGGGVVAYLREVLVTRRRWIDDEEFLTALEISQALPGLNAVNMAILVGDRLRGVRGAVAAGLGITLPGTAVVFVLGLLYASHGETPAVAGVLAGVGAAAAGLLAAVAVQLGRRQLTQLPDAIIVAIACVAVGGFRVSLVVILLTLAPIAVWWYRPRA